jgi:hypothetical protein
MFIKWLKKKGMLPSKAAEKLGIKNISDITDYKKAMEILK